MSLKNLLSLVLKLFLLVILLENQELKKDYIFTYKDITEEEISTLKKLFGHLSKGNSLHYQLIDSVLYSIKLKDEKKFKELCDIIYAR